jgi:hypothetical protein
LSASVPSHHTQFSVAFTTNIAESNFWYTQLGNARLRDIKPELEQFTVDTRRTPKQILHAHLPDQRAEVRLDLRPPSPSPRLPTPVAAKAGTMPPHERLRLDDREDLQNRRKPSI